MKTYFMDFKNTNHVNFHFFCSFTKDDYVQVSHSTFYEYQTYKLIQKARYEVVIMHNMIVEDDSNQSVNLELLLI
jgi:hypothetical protein